MINIPLDEEKHVKLEATDDEVETERLNKDTEEQPAARFVYDMNIIILFGAEHSP